MRYATRKDANHNEIVSVLASCGWSILETHRHLGLGFDCIITKGARLYFVEIKDGKKVASARKLTVSETLAQQIFSRWFVVINSVNDVLQINRMQNQGVK